MTDDELIQKMCELWIGNAHELGRVKMRQVLALVRAHDCTQLAKEEAERLRAWYKALALKDGPNRGFWGRAAAKAITERKQAEAEAARLRDLILHETGEDKDGLMPHEPREALLILRRAALQEGG